VDKDIRADHAIVEAVADDDRAVMQRLAALEAEVKADADAQSARKAAALAKLRDQRVTQTAERDQLRTRQAALVGKKRPEPEPEPEPEIEAPARSRRRALANDDDEAEDHADRLENLSGALELASKANRVKQELSRPARNGDKSWVKSGVVSLALGPVGWLYAGSMREAVPATVGSVALAALALKILPLFLILPVWMVAAPLSAIAGVVYALQYNRNGSRQRLFDRDDKANKTKQRQLRSGSP
jgi:hypothetical protein